MALFTHTGGFTQAPGANWVWAGDIVRNSGLATFDVHLSTLFTNLNMAGATITVGAASPVSYTGGPVTSRGTGTTHYIINGTVSGDGRGLAMRAESLSVEYVTFNNAVTGGPTYHISPPTGTAAGDTLLFVMRGDNTRAVSMPAGWSFVATADNGGGAKTIVYSKIAGASEPAVDFTFTGSGDGNGILFAYRGGASPAGAATTTAGGVNSGTITGPTLSPSGPALAVGYQTRNATGNGSTTIDTSTGWKHRETFSGGAVTVMSHDTYESFNGTVGAVSWTGGLNSSVAAVTLWLPATLDRIDVGAGNLSTAYGFHTGTPFGSSAAYGFH